MPESNPPSIPSTGQPEADVAKRQKALVDQLLARDAWRCSASISLPGQSLNYEVVASFVPVVAEGFDSGRGEPEAAVLTTAYLMPGVEAGTRPVCFAFNGGPGSSSIWLQFGALGPKRVVVPDDGSMPRPPYAVSDNPHSWLEHFDLVFIDPPHTGWSVSASDEARKKHLSVDGDVDALAEVMRQWLTRHKRWGSPLYLAGESYGTTRGAALADKLQSMGAALTGLILVSCAMDLQTLVFTSSNHLPYALFLPAMANVAQYHGLLKGRLADDAAAARAAAEAFVAEDYLAALHAGSRLGDKRRAALAQRIAELTGLSRSVVERKNLRIDDNTFFGELLQERGLIVGRLDARATSPMAASRKPEMEFDPGIEAISAPYTMAAAAWLGQTLGVDLGTRYQIISSDVGKAWNWNRGGNSLGGFASTSADLGRALRRNPHLRVFVASGRYDLGTPYSASDWSLAQLDIPADVASRVQHRYYDAGHMMYTRQADLTQMKSDLAAWLG